MENVTLTTSIGSIIGILCLWFASIVITAGLTYLICRKFNGQAAADLEQRRSQILIDELLSSFTVFRETTTEVLDSLSKFIGRPGPSMPTPPLSDPRSTKDNKNGTKLISSARIPNGGG